MIFIFSILQTLLSKCHIWKWVEVFEMIVKWDCNDKIDFSFLSGIALNRQIFVFYDRKIGQKVERERDKEKEIFIFIKYILLTAHLLISKESSTQIQDWSYLILLSCSFHALIMLRLCSCEYDHTKNTIHQFFYYNFILNDNMYLLIFLNVWYPNMVNHSFYREQY